MKNTLFVLFGFFLFLGCNKHKPKIGDYEARFYCSDASLIQFVGEYRYRELQIVNVNDKEIFIDIYNDGSVSSVLDKDGKVVSGIIMMPGQGGTGGPSYPSNEIYITGTWEKKNGKYSIKGFHQYIYYEVDVQNQEIHEHVVSGDFEITSK